MAFFNKLVVSPPVFMQDSIVLVILQRYYRIQTLPGRHIPHSDCTGMGLVCAIIKLPHHQGGLGITPLPALGMAAFYSVTSNMVSWLGSHPHAPQWVAGQNLADPTTWKCSSLTTLKQLHDQFLLN
jgi:hypothetical protein